MTNLIPELPTFLSRKRANSETKSDVVMLSTPDEEVGHVPAENASTEAQALANDLGEPVTAHHPVSGKVVAKAKPKKASPKAKSAVDTAQVKKLKQASKAKAEAKGPTNSKVTTKAAPKASKPKSDVTMTDKVITLASRKQGASAAELNELTGWHGCPWKWSFANPKNTGWCQKRGLKFHVEKNKDAEVRYHVG